jgi:hypothetical protein
MWLFWGTPRANGDAWGVRRWMAIVAFRFLVLEGVWVLSLLSYAIMVGTEPQVDLTGWGVILGAFTAGLTTIIGKYIHDATQDQRHERETNVDPVD